MEYHRKMRLRNALPQKRRAKMKIFTLERREKQKTFQDEKKSLIFFLCSFCLCLRHEKLSINFLLHRRLRLLAAEPENWDMQNISRLPV